MLVKKYVSTNVFIVICLFETYFDICFAYHLFPNYNNTLIRTRRQADCRSPNFRCNDGTCLPFYKVCDASVDCPDGADEYDQCNLEPCREFTFQCAYGACVDGDARCDGKPDCRDKSDEEGCQGSANTSNSNCGTKFTCKTSGECVFYYKVCDGRKDCQDGSDETYAVCKDVPCPDHAFRCSYGACVDGEYKCNKKQECADGSDEAPALCTDKVVVTPTPKPPVANGYCAPPNLKNGEYDVLGKGYVTGTPVPNYSLVRFTCRNSYALYPSNAIVNCVDGNWNLPLPECKSTCPPRISSSVDVECTVDGSVVDCTKPLVEGTVAIGKCKNFYTQTHDEVPTSKCSGTSWDNPLIRCIPECGDLVSDGDVNIVNSAKAKKGEYPWHVGIYRLLSGKQQYQCGGSIITPVVILTAAHCFTDEYGTVRYPAKEYYIAAGKYYSDYNSKMDHYAQKSQVKEYYIPPEYRGYDSSYAGDFAVAVIFKQFQMTHLVQPVCVDWGNTFEREQLKPNEIGHVVGWGYENPEIFAPSVELRILNAPFVDVGQCLDIVPQTFRRWVTTDKYCAGYTNGSSVCKGDSGGGMVYDWTVNNKQKYYIRGLVSAGPVKKGTCDHFQYGVYTKISVYRSLLQDVITNNRIVDK